MNKKCQLSVLPFGNCMMISICKTIPADKNLRAGDWGWTEGKVPMVNRVPQVHSTTIRSFT